MGFLRKLAMLVVADAVCMTCVYTYKKAKENYTSGKNVFGKPIKKMAVRQVDGKTYIFMGKEDANVA